MSAWRAREGWPYSSCAGCSAAEFIENVIPSTVCDIVSLSRLGNRSETTDEQTTCSNEVPSQPLFLLICCMNDCIGDSVVRLQQLSIHDIDSDRRLFHTPSQRHTTLRHRRWSFPSLWSSKHINSVNFNVDDKLPVDIKDVHGIRPNNEHTHLHQPTWLKPPIGSNLLMSHMLISQDAKC